MSTLAVGPAIDALIERRRALGQDGHDEVWEGVYHVAPHAHSRHGKVELRLARFLDSFADAAGLEVVGAFNLGTKDDYRVPDLAVRDSDVDDVYVPTARLVIEVLSPGDETFDTFEFYAAHHVDEIVVADPELRTVRWWKLTAGRYVPTSVSAVLVVSCDDVQAGIVWP